MSDSKSQDIPVDVVSPIRYLGVTIQPGSKEADGLELPAKLVEQLQTLVPCPVKVKAEADAEAEAEAKTETKKAAAKKAPLKEKK